MNFTMKNTLKTFAGIAVLGIAMFTQSFTESARAAKAEKLAGEVWTNSTVTGDYEQLPANEPYNPEFCENSSENTCAYVRTEKPGAVPANFDATEALVLEADSLIEQVDTNTGIYNHP